MKAPNPDVVTAQVERIFEAAKHEALALVLKCCQEADFREAISTVPSEAQDSEAMKLKAQLQLIAAKEFLTINEAALLLSCSASHVRNLIKKARMRKTRRPIPFRDLDGVIVFQQVELLAWSESLKPTSQEIEPCPPDASGDKLQPASLAAVRTERRSNR
jgi:hypothetical protein